MHCSDTGQMIWQKQCYSGQMIQQQQRSVRSSMTACVQSKMQPEASQLRSHSAYRTGDAMCCVVIMNNRTTVARDRYNGSSKCSVCSSMSACTRCKIHLEARVDRLHSTQKRVVRLHSAQAGYTVRRAGSGRYKGMPRTAHAGSSRNAAPCSS
jgi:hypothetical protein